MLAIANVLVSSLFGAFLLLVGFSLSKTVFKKEVTLFYHMIAGLILLCVILVLPSLIIGTLCVGTREYFIFVILALAIFLSYCVISKRLIHSVKRSDLKKFVPVLLFVTILFARHILLLGGGGIIGWDSFYIPIFPLLDPSLSLIESQWRILAGRVSYSRGHLQ